MINPYKDQLDGLLTGGSYFGTPGFQFARDQGLNAASAKFNKSGMGNSGNVLAELSRLASGYASQDYGNQVDRLGKLSGQQDQYELGLGQNANAATRNANDLALGTTRNANDFALGNDRNANDLFGKAGDLQLGGERNFNDAQNNWWANESRNRVMDQNDTKNYNDWGLGWGELGVRQQQANTNLGDSRSRNWLANYKTRGFGQG